MLFAIVLIPLFLLFRWISFPRANDSLPRLFLSKLEVKITFFESFQEKNFPSFEFCIYANCHFALAFTLNPTFLCSHKTLDTTILWSNIIKWYRNILFFSQQNHLDMSCIYFLVQISVERYCSSIHLVQFKSSMPLIALWF